MGWDGKEAEDEDPLERDCTCLSKPP
jgi:hypothetical protein